MKTTELNLKLIESVHVTEDGRWFYFDSEGPTHMRPVVSPDESIYAYSHGNERYREAMEVIFGWKEDMGFDEEE